MRGPGLQTLRNCCHMRTGTFGHVPKLSIVKKYVFPPYLSKNTIVLHFENMFPKWLKTMYNVLEYSKTFYDNSVRLRLAYGYFFHLTFVQYCTSIASRVSPCVTLFLPSDNVCARTAEETSSLFGIDVESGIGLAT